MEHLTHAVLDRREAKTSFRPEATARSPAAHDQNPQVSALDTLKGDAPFRRRADELALARWEEEGGRIASNQGPSTSARSGKQPGPEGGDCTPALLEAKPQTTALKARAGSMQAVSFELAEIADELAREPAFLREGHCARTLARSADLRVVLVALEEGKKSSEHHAGVTATIQVVSGRVLVRLAGRNEELGPAQLLLLAPGTRHELQALADSAFVLTLGWSSH